jgi:hypothetical protein
MKIQISHAKSHAQMKDRCLQNRQKIQIWHAKSHGNGFLRVPNHMPRSMHFGRLGPSGMPNHMETNLPNHRTMNVNNYRIAVGVLS